MHLAGFFSAITDGSTYATVNAIPDNSLSINSSNRYISPRPYRVVGATAWGDALTAARLNVPSLRNVALPEIYPPLISATPTSQTPFIWYGDRGPTIITGEEFGVDASVGTQTVDVAYALVWLMDKFDPPPGGPVITITATASVTKATGTWALGNIAFSQTLPSGRYAVVGAAAYGTTMAAFRLVFPGTSEFRPGGVSGVAYGNYQQFPSWRAGHTGKWGEFTNTSPPQVEALGTAAGAITLSLLIDIVKIG